MDSTLIFGVLIVITLLGSVSLKSYLDKKGIERAREMVDLHDDLRRMQNAMAIIPDLYLDTPTKIFMIKRIMQLISKVQKVGNESESLTMLTLDLEAQLAKTLDNKDDSVKRLSEWGKIEHPDTAHEIRTMSKYLHGQILACVKNNLVPRAHGARVVKNLKVIMHRIALDLNYNLAKNAIRANKLRPALGKLKVAKGALLKSPIKQHLKTQLEELEKLIEKVERKMEVQRKKASASTENKLASGVDKIKEEEAREAKNNMYDGE
jgi:hypothetical protein